jgi:hypothetical protein
MNKFETFSVKLLNLLQKMTKIDLNPLGLELKFEIESRITKIQ